MNSKRPFVIILMLAGLLAGSRITGAQNAASTNENPGHARKVFAVNLMRAINTAEASYRQAHGSYVAWDTLMPSEEFSGNAIKWAAQNDSELAKATFSKRQDILPGWRLRLLVSADGASYEALLEDTSDKACAYAVVSDERGIIRQSKEIQCQM